MSNEIKRENSNGGFEHEDWQPSGIVYFLLSLLVVTVLCMFGLRGFYDALDHHERTAQEVPSPLVKNVPEDSRHVSTGYPQTAFPSPQLEEDERGQLNGILLKQDETLYSYGWVDEKAGIVRIPIDRAMDLLVQRGLPVLPAGMAGQSAAAATESKERSDQARAVKGKSP
jgi:hypothetical protein